MKLCLWGENSSFVKGLVKNMSIKWKIILPVVIIMTSLVIVTTVFSILRFTGYTGILFDERIKESANALKKYLRDCELDTRVAAISASRNSEVIAAINKRDTKGILRHLSSSLDLYHVDFFVVTDAAGIVLARTHGPDVFGDSISNQKNIREALNNNVHTCVEEGVLVKVSVRTGAPVYHNGKIIGVILAGLRLDTNEAVDYLKDHHSADFTVFYGDTRIATTVMKDGERIVGTRLDPNIAKAVIEDKKEYFGYADVYGENYSAFYMPLLNNQGEVFSVIFAGRSNANLISERTILLRNHILIGVIGLAVSIVTMLFIISRIIRPVKRLAYAVSEIARGNSNIDIDKTDIAKDDIGALILDIYSLVEVNKSMTIDVSQLIYELSTRGDIDYMIDTSKYSGSYKEIIDGIKALADSVSMMRKTMAAMDYLDTMISVVDLKYNLLYINRSMADTYGIDRNSCIGKKCYNVIRNLDRPCPICQLENILPKKDSFPSIDYENLYDETSGSYIVGRAAIIRWVDGAQVFFNSIKDETMKIKYQEQLRESAAAAQAATVAKSEFLANMSHEIRTPMNSIIGLSELALDDDISLKTRNYLNLINENSQGLLQIINDILDLSKVESGKIELEIIPFDLHDLFKSCKTIILPRASEKNIEIFFYAEPAVGKRLLGDPTRLRQVLINLLSNAVKFTDEGSVKLLVVLENLTKHDITLRFKISDSGIGMTPDQTKRIFEPFMQADASMTRKYGGTGLGLPITKNIIELMGGKIEIESELGVGTTISFVLTFDTTDITDDSSETANIKEIEKPVFEGDILVCEDNLMNRRVIIEHLERVGLNVEIAENGQEGIDKVKKRIDNGEKQFDLIFMDIQMPVMDGIEAAPKIIQLAAGTPVVAMTANIMTGDREQYKSLGMNDSVGKPFTSQELWHCLLKYLKPVDFAGAGKNEKGDDNKLQKQLMIDFVTSNQTKFKEINDAIDAGDIALAHRLAHTLKSNAAYIGRLSLQKAAADVEAALKGGEKQVTAAQMDTLKNELSAALDELAPYRNEQADLQPAEPYDAEKARELLAKLEPLLKSGNPECLKFVDELRSIPGSGELIKQIEDFYFDAAAKLLSELKERL